jgi:hypothetical protein
LNPQLRRAGNYQRNNVGGSPGLTTSFRNISAVTGAEEYVYLSAVLSAGRHGMEHNALLRENSRYQRRHVIGEGLVEGGLLPLFDDQVSSRHRRMVSSKSPARAA